MGIFSLFGKKNDRKENTSSDKASSKKNGSRSDNPFSSTTIIDENGSNSLLMQRHIARATERKIDAIEFEMSRDIVKTKLAPATKTAEALITDIPTTVVQSSEHLSPDFLSTLPLHGATTDYLLHSNTDFAPSLSPTESMPVLEEAAILFASGQAQVAEQMLMAAIKQDKLAHATQAAWFMLFDIYQINNKQHEFESLSLDYANKFEMSPPHWIRAQDDMDPTTQVIDEATPTIVFPQTLDGNITVQLEKLQALGLQSRSLRLDFMRIRQVDPVGCGLLLHALRNLRKTKHDLMLIGAQDLNQKIRAIIAVGRRDETEAPWLLLLEILQLLHFEREFEEVSMDYCVTFEVSPHAFVAPDNRVNTSFPEITLIDDVTDRFIMPAVIEGKTDALTLAIAEFSKQNNLVLLDCSHLQRVEFGASAQLLSGLVPLAGKKGITIQFHDVNYPVLFLLNAMGFKNVASIFPHKQ